MVHPITVVTVVTVVIVCNKRQELKITIEPLPVYSPDFMPVEHLWQWLREEVTYHAC